MVLVALKPKVGTRSRTHTPKSTCPHRYYIEESWKEATHQGGLPSPLHSIKTEEEGWRLRARCSVFCTVDREAREYEGDHVWGLVVGDGGGHFEWWE
jgi:hypothetical protein